MDHNQRLDRIEEQAGDLAEAFHALAGEVAHLDAPGVEILDALLGRVQGVARALGSASGQADELAAALQERLTAWWQTNRFTAAGRSVTLARLAQTVERGAERARALLLEEIADALQAREGDHAVRLLDATAAWSGIPRSASDPLRTPGSDPLALHEVVRVLRERAGMLRRGRSSTATRTLGVVQAWLIQAGGDPTSALGILDELVARAPADPRLLVERAGLRLAAADAALAADDAHLAIELDGSDPRGYIQAGVIAEAAGEVADAVELYTEGSRRLPAGRSLVAAPQWASFLHPTGLFHLTRARLLSDAGEPAAALAAVDQALAQGISGPATYPEADAYDLRRQLLQELGAEDHAVADAAYEAGKRHLWNGNASQAAEALWVATRNAERLPDAGWYLALSLMLADTSDVDTLQGAKRVWDDWAARVGPPGPESAWAYADRASLDMYIDSLTEMDSAPSAWRALVLCEKGLVLDAQQAEVWATLSYALRRLSLAGLAMEAVEAGYRANPDSTRVLEERLAVLTNEGRTSEALETWDRLPDAATDPWQSGVKAYLLQRLGRPEEALDYLERPLSGTWDLGWYRELRTACLVDLGRLDEAVADLRALLHDESPWSGQGHYRRAMARSVLGDLAEARAELTQAQADQTLGAQEKCYVTGLVALAEGELTKAAQLLEQTVLLATNSATLEDLPRDVDRVLTLHRHLGRPVTGGDELVARLADLAGTHHPEPPSAEGDIESALASAEAGPECPSDVALTAVRARRQLEGGLAEQAAALYQELLGTSFEPEASRALGQALGGVYHAAVGRGDVERAQEAYAGMAALGHAPQPFSEVAHAEALWGGGRYAEATGVLAALAPEVEDPTGRLQVLGLLGQCALFAGEPSLAEPALREAAYLAALAEDHNRVAQLAVRQAVADLMSQQPGSVAEHLSQARRAWSAAGIFDSAAVLRQELGWLLAALPEGTLDAESREALREQAERLSTRPDDEPAALDA